MCHPAITKFRRGVIHPEYTDEDIHMLKRMIDLRITQVDNAVLV